MNVPPLTSVSDWDARFSVAEVRCGVSVPGAVPPENEIGRLTASVPRLEARATLSGITLLVIPPKKRGKAYVTPYIGTTTAGLRGAF